MSHSPVYRERGLTIAAGFNGPPTSANGGYACGRLAAMAAEHLEGPVAVTLLSPVPLAVPLVYRVSGRRGQAWAGDELVATVSPANDEVVPVPGISPAEAEVAAESFLGRTGHPFPTCFACGVDRGGEGLGLTPGQLPGRFGTVACVWSPDERHADASGTIAAEVVWAALDCPGGWTTDPRIELRLLGRMTTRVVEPPRASRPCVVVGQRTGGGGHVVVNSTALYDAEDGKLLASATAHWVAV
ncbi:hypothetical protein SAMN05216223_11554 [Actinacidiphila yanglinensis]|uniref:Thioesterase family protein n=1 Tax=Actinacidiphila yanglinensis TaxID=310779 RepID=A0A1H6DGJ3_9ACTN|nr:hypothetical protein [Actinacidiphila yanglinensis]SEG84334.1 hypothetical protein SAMN05216223_11554 [Actinacidiphila yanglinensis]